MHLELLRISTFYRSVSNRILLQDSYCGSTLAVDVYFIGCGSTRSLRGYLMLHIYKTVNILLYHLEFSKLKIINR